MTERRIIPPPMPVTADIAAVKKEKAVRKIGIRIFQVMVFIPWFINI